MRDSKAGEVHFGSAHHLSNAVMEVTCASLAFILLCLDYCAGGEFLLVNDGGLQPCFFQQLIPAIAGKPE